MTHLAVMDSHTSHLSLPQAAALLGVEQDLMLAWNMVVVLTDGEVPRVPRWCTEARITRVLPILSEVFQGEALAFCLNHFEPFGDGRTALEALRDGEWQAVLERLTALRRDFDSIMQQDSRSITTAAPRFA